MFLNQLRELDHLTPQERTVADYLLEHLEELEDLSATMLAKKSYTSKATVVRLSQKLGLSGFQELKVKLLVEVNQQERLNQLLAEEPITGETRPDELLQILPNLYDKALTNTKLSLKKSHLNRIATYLEQAERIEFYGTGISYHLAQAAAFKLGTLGREVHVYESLNHHYLTARKSKKTVAILLSFTGANQQICQMARYLRQTTDSRILAVAGPHHQDLLPFCHELIEIPNRDSLLSLDVVSSFAACNYVLDLLFALLLTRQYENHLHSSLQMRDFQDKFEC